MTYNKTNTKTFTEHLQRLILETCEPSSSPSPMGRHRMSPADSNSSQEQVQRPLFSSLFLSNPLKKRFLCLQYSGGSDVEVSAGSQYVPTRISCVKNSPEQKLKFPPEPKLSFGVQHGRNGSHSVATICICRLGSFKFQILCQKKQVSRLVQIICCFQQKAERFGFRWAPAAVEQEQ